MPGITDTIVATKPSEATVPEALISSVNRAQLAKQKGDLQAKDLALKDLVLGLKQDALRREIKAGKDSLAQEQKFYTLKREYDSLQDTKTLENQYDAAYRKGDKKEMSHLAYLLASRKDASAAWKAKYHSTTPSGLAEAGLTGAGRDAYLRKQGINPSDADALAIVTGAKLDFGSPTHAKRGGALSDNQYLDIILRAGDVVPKAGTLTHTKTKPTDQESKLSLWNANEPFIVSTRGTDYFNQIKESILSEREVSDAEIQYAIGNMNEQEYKDALAIEQKRKAGAETQAVQVLGAEIDKMKESLMTVNGWTEAQFNAWKGSVLGKMELEGSPIRQKVSTATVQPTGNQEYDAKIGLISDTPENAPYTAMLGVMSAGATSKFAPVFRAGRLANILNSESPEKTERAREYMQSVAFETANAKQQDFYTSATELEDQLHEVSRLLQDPKVVKDLGVMSVFRKGNEILFRGTTNPDVIKLATNLTAAMQKYRKSVTGAAASGVEIPEYKQLFGSLWDDPKNLGSKVGAMLDISQRSQVNFYKNRTNNADHASLLAYPVREMSEIGLARVAYVIQDMQSENKTREEIQGRMRKATFIKDGRRYRYSDAQITELLESQTWKDVISP